MTRATRALVRTGLVCLFAIAWAGLIARTPPAKPSAPYQESLRPRFHFTAKAGYINDPNGLFHLDGTYHLFFQHGDIKSKAWGHATSTDLLHWTQHAAAIEPKDGHPVFSGSAVIDSANTSGFGTAADPPVVAVFTEWGLGQSLAFSTDKGKTWTRYKDNPVLKLPGDDKRSFALSARDPHVMWDADRRRWVLVLYHNVKQKAVEKNTDGRHRLGFSIFTSPDLKAWTYRSHLDDFYVCPDLFRLPVEGTKTRKWVAMDWERYTVGEFDGEAFTGEQPIAPLDHGASLSANQSWKHLPDGRTVQVCWIRGGKYPDMPFDQQMSVPTELSLRKIGDAVRLCKNPIRELDRLHGQTVELKDRTIDKDFSLALETPTHSFDLAADLQLKDGEELRIQALGREVVLSRDRVVAVNKTCQLAEPLTHVRLLADVTSLELFLNRGEATMTFAVSPPEKPAAVTLSPGNGMPTVRHARLSAVESVWK